MRYILYFYFIPKIHEIMTKTTISNKIEESVPPINYETPTQKEYDEGSSLVDWDGPGDAANPINWSNTQKWTIIGLVSFTTFNVYDISLAQDLLSIVEMALIDFHRLHGFEYFRPWSTASDAGLPLYQLSTLDIRRLCFHCRFHSWAVGALAC